jgi:hypothetical protein
LLKSSRYAARQLSVGATRKVAANMLKAKNFLLLFTVFILPLILSEMLARIIFPEPTRLYIPSNDFRLIYELNPRYPEINSFGMRQEELDPSTLRAQFVIAVIGDSHTFHFARRQNSFPARLEHHLKVLTGKNIKVLNFGVPGYDMAQELEILKVKALQFRPNLIILQYCINDEHISNYIQPKYPWLNRTIHQNRLLSSAWKLLLYSEFGQKHLLLSCAGGVDLAKNRYDSPGLRPTGDAVARHPSI